MARSATASPPPDLLAALNATAANEAKTSESTKADAIALYWRTLGHIVDGDAGGGCPAATFASALAVLGLGLADVQRDLAGIRACRDAQKAADEGTQQLSVLQTALAEAEAAAAAAKATAEIASAKANRSAAEVAAGMEELTLRRAALKEARGVATSLTARGFGGVLCSATPIEAPPAPRRWRITAQHLHVAGKLLLRGSIIDLPHAAVLSHHDAVLVDTGTTLVEILPKPGEPGSNASMLPIDDSARDPQWEVAHHA